MPDIDFESLAVCPRRYKVLNQLIGGGLSTEQLEDLLSKNYTVKALVDEAAKFKFIAFSNTLGARSLVKGILTEGGLSPASVREVRAILGTLEATIQKFGGEEKMYSFMRGVLE